MSEPFLAEIKLFAGNFAPRGYAFCDGQLLSISQNTAVFALVGTTYGGDGRTTFGLPDLRGRFAMHPGSGPGLTARRLGEKGGAAEVTVTEAQIPSHAHDVLGAAQGSTSPRPAGAALAEARVPTYASDAPSASMGELGLGGGSQAHTNVHPYLGVNYIIALQGLFPSRS